MFKVGDKVKIVSARYGWGLVDEGAIGIVQDINYNWDDSIESYIINVPGKSDYWRAAPADIKLATRERRAAKILVPSTEREKVAVKLARKVVTGPGKFTAFKVESEGRMSRGDRCTDDCSYRRDRKPHVGCQYFSDNRVANDFILRELAKHGLAKRCKQGENPWGHLYTPRTPLVFSKVYNDSETEWTMTMLLKRASDVLYAPFIVDAFNALATANGRGIDVTGSGMHTAFIQGKDGIYPSGDRQNKHFDNFARSMRPLLPALYLLGANRVQDGKLVTRGTGFRQPMVSREDKYSAIAYRYGALEFRIFDTCYEHRDQLLDNLVVMANSVVKYWKQTYVKPAIKLTTPVLFGSSECSDNPVNSIERLYLVKEHIVLLNEGLRCIKPSYYTVTQIKKDRNFNLTVRGIKDALNTHQYAEQYQRYVRDTQLRQVKAAASEFYALLDRLQGSGRDFDLQKEMRKLRARANRLGKKKHPIGPIETVAYKAQFGKAWLLGEA